MVEGVNEISFLFIDNMVRGSDVLSQWFAWQA